MSSQATRESVGRLHPAGFHPLNRSQLRRQRPTWTPQSLRARGITGNEQRTTWQGLFEFIETVGCDLRALEGQTRHPKKSKATHGKLRAKDRPLANDFVSDQAFDELLHAWFGNMARVLAPGRGFYIWGGYGNLGNYPPVLKATGLYFSPGIVWDKQHPVLTRKDFMGCFEKIAYYGWREGAAHKFLRPGQRA